jgi:Flp pilus assembly protein TadB
VPAGQRARRREERDRLAAEAAASRQAVAAKQARRESRRTALVGWVPTPAPVESGSLAAKRRQRTGLVLAFVLAVNVLVWLGTGEWAARVLMLLLTVLVAPIVVSILNRK